MFEVVLLMTLSNEMIRQTCDELLVMLRLRSLLIVAAADVNAGYA